MKSAFSRFDCRGEVAMEFMFIVIPFMTLFLVTFDLGRFFLTEHSVRTLASELARQTLIHCTGSGVSLTTTCTLPASGAFPSVANAKSNVPFLGSSGYASSPTSSRSAVDSGNGTMLITSSVSYNFSFLPVWSLFAPTWATDKTISQTTTMRY